MKILLELFMRGLAFLSVLGMLWFGGMGLLVYLVSGHSQDTSGKPDYLTHAILPTILCAAVFFAYLRYESARRKSILARAKQQFGIDFSHGRWMGKWEGVVVIFDEPSRKILISALGGNSISVHPYEYIKSWRLTWVETSSNGRLSEKDAKMELELNDLDRPHLAVPMPSKRDGQAWSSRLDILLGSR